MFGFVKPYGPDLTEAEKKRYRGLYCGLCRTLNEKYGLAGRLGLNYDMTFLTILLSSLYEPKEEKREAVCPPHPIKKHPEIITPYTAYAADMTVALAYYKALDDWEDEKKAVGKVRSDMLKKHYLDVKEKWSAQCAAIEESISAIHAVEKDGDAQPEEAADLSGRMLGRVFSPKEDFFSSQVTALGYFLGKFIYMMDAAVDYEHDAKKGCYNPLPKMNVTPAEARELMLQPLGQAAEIFERLPLVQDVGIMRNILYSGVWQTYNEKMKQEDEKDKMGQEGDNHGQ